MIWDKLRKRRLSAIGFALILVAIDIFITGKVIVYDVSSNIGEILPLKTIPFLAVSKPTRQLPEAVVKVFSWPFYMPLLLGGTLIAIDLNEVMKERKTSVIGGW